MTCVGAVAVVVTLVASGAAAGAGAAVVTVETGAVTGTVVLTGVGGSRRGL